MEVDQPAMVETAAANKGSSGNNTTNGGDLFGVEVRRKLKLQAHVTSKLGKHKDKEKRLGLFWNNVWPALEKLGWSKVDGEDRMTGSITFLLPGNTMSDDLVKGVNYFDSIRDVLDRVLERQNAEEAEIADDYIKAFGETNRMGKDGFGKPGRGRKRINLGQAGRSANKLLDTSWKESRYFIKHESRVGDEYQVKDIPSAGSYKSVESSEDKQYTEVWDSALAKEKCVDFARVDATHHSKKEELLSKLHEAGYDMSKYDDIVNSITAMDGSDWPEEKKKQYHLEIFKVRKDLEAVSKALDVPMKTTLAYYYGSFKTSDDYRLLKTVCVDERLSEEGESLEFGYDSCAICGDGGSLVICDGCEGEFHLHCLSPPLKSVPEGYWECDDCVDKKLLAARNYLVSQTKLFVKKEDTKKREADEKDAKDDKEENTENSDEQPGFDIEMYEPTDEVLQAIKKFCHGISSVLTPPAVKTE